MKLNFSKKKILLWGLIFGTLELRNLRVIFPYLFKSKLIEIITHPSNRHENFRLFCCPNVHYFIYFRSGLFACLFVCLFVFVQFILIPDFLKKIYLFYVCINNLIVVHLNNLVVCTSEMPLFLLKKKFPFFFLTNQKISFFFSKFLMFLKQTL